MICRSIKRLHILTFALLPSLFLMWMSIRESTPAPVPSVEVSVEEEESVPEDALWLARIMEAEAGPEWPDWAIMAVGEVVLNRVASPEFPDNVVDVLSQTDPVQYAPVHTDTWDASQPSERYLELADRLIAGERVLHDPLIVFQALFPQGSVTVVSYYDVTLGTTTYWCRSSYPELYEVSANAP